MGGVYGKAQYYNFSQVQDVSCNCFYTHLDVGIPQVS